MKRSRRKGRQFGQNHQNAVLTDAEVDLIRDLYDEGFYSYTQLARMFEVSKGCVGHLVHFRRRTRYVGDGGA